MFLLYHFDILVVFAYYVLERIADFFRNPQISSGGFSVVSNRNCAFASCWRTEYVHPYFGLFRADFQFDEHIVQSGWNHQLDEIWWKNPPLAKFGFGQKGGHTILELPRLWVAIVAWMRRMNISWDGKGETWHYLLVAGCWLLVVIGLVAQKSDGVGFDSAGLSSCNKNSLPISPTKITFQALHKGGGSQQPKVMRWIPATQIHGCWSCYVLGHLAEQKRTGGEIHGCVKMPPATILTVQVWYFGLSYTSLLILHLGIVANTIMASCIIGELCCHPSFAWSICIICAWQGSWQWFLVMPSSFMGAFTMRL